MWLKTIKKLLKSISKERVFCVLFSAYIAAVLWITLFSRNGNGVKGVLFPLQSYVKIMNGNWYALLENTENIVLFIPLGLALGLIIKQKNVILAFFCGLAVSLIIELSQVILVLGIFEFDDLLHNTLGVVVGYYAIRLTSQKVILKNKEFLMILLLSVMFSAVPIGCQEMHFLKMKKLAALHDRKDGKRNLLVLKGKDGYAWNTNVYIKYLKDGSIRIKGKSHKKSWWPIADVELEPGRYTFSGLSDVGEGTVGLELENNNSRFANDVGPIDKIEFVLDDTKIINVYVIVYDECDCDVVATPVLYKEE
jgi:glycopeptide antibiotics resistance protein